MVLVISPPADRFYSVHQTLCVFRILTGCAAVCPRCPRKLLPVWKGATDPVKDLLVDLEHQVLLFGLEHQDSQEVKPHRKTQQEKNPTPDQSFVVGLYYTYSPTTKPFFNIWLHA